jgi:alkylation response protein AidB-like acyl-CoA dehydrogenase
VQHQLADVHVGLELARPLVHAAALAMGSGTASRDVSAAKVAAGQAAQRAARAALQVHGAIGYTRELDLWLWLLKVPALVRAWGTPAYHRARVRQAW